MTLARAISMLLGLALPALPACQGRAAHFLVAYVYEPANECLDAPAVVDVVNGPPPPAPCPILRCWLAPSGIALVTDQACDVPPDYQDQTRTGTGACVKALAAYGKSGHQRCPAPAEAGPEAGS